MKANVNFILLRWSQDGTLCFHCLLCLKLNSLVADQIQLIVLKPTFAH